MPENTTQIFNRYRVLLFSIAYRMLSSAMDAEDIVHEAFLRWLQVNEEEVLSPKAYLITVVMRLCIDHLRLARVRREVYVGPWLPEPIATGQGQGLGDTVVLAESLSFAFLIMLERLGPVERAIFLLREVFDYDYDEIARIVSKSEANCRQILRRARQRLDQGRRRFEVSGRQQERITQQFLRAVGSGDIQGLLDLLADDIVFIADGGGKAKTSLKPVHGVDKVARGLLRGLQQALPPESQIAIEEINAQPAIVGYVEGHPIGVMLLDIEEERVGQIYAVVNPDKLGWLKKQRG